MVSLFTYDISDHLNKQVINMGSTEEVHLYYSVNIKVIFITKKGREQKMDGSCMTKANRPIYLHCCKQQSSVC